MREMCLTQGWKMRCVQDKDWQDAQVPGTVYTDLLRNGAMPDPFWKDREDSICALMNQDYEYECRFTPETGFSQDDRVLLHFDGLDTVATIYWNGEVLGEAYNMHRVWEFDVTDRLKAGENIVRVYFHSPLVYIAEAYKKYGNIGNDDTYEGFMHLRKAHYMFGWDWGAHLPDAGIFRPVKLLGVQKARIDSVYVRQHHEEDRVTLSFETASDCDNGQWRVTVTAPDGTAQTITFAQGQVGTMDIDAPQL